VGGTAVAVTVGGSAVPVGDEASKAPKSHPDPAGLVASA
jgi:hypothetical protein